MLDFIPGQKPEDRPDIVNRVFMIKLNELIEDIYKKKRFGKATGSKFPRFQTFSS
jgi:hypothetical protein